MPNQVPSGPKIKFTHLPPSEVRNPAVKWLKCSLGKQIGNADPSVVRL